MRNDCTGWLIFTETFALNVNINKKLYELYGILYCLA